MFLNLCRDFFSGIFLYSSLFYIILRISILSSSLFEGGSRGDLLFLKRERGM